MPIKPNTSGIFYFSLVSVILIILVSGSPDQPRIKGPVIGIDLGTSFSCVGVFLHKRVKIITNVHGNRLTPSYVAFTEDGDRLIGESAKDQAHSNPLNTIFSIKRLIGRRFDDPLLQEDSKLLPYTIVDKKGIPHIQLNTKQGFRNFAPEEITAMILGRMRETAESFLGESIKYAVITVPANFNDSQRQATKDAGTIAGLVILNILNEPTAAAIAYGFNKKGEPPKNVLIYDLGGGTFDVSLLKIDNGAFEVLATAGDTHLGGDDFDNRVIVHLMEKFKEKSGKDAFGDKRAIQVLRNEVEKGKRALSYDTEVEIEIEGFFDGVDFKESITRGKFEELNSELFLKTLVLVKQVLADAKIEKENVDEIILAGGSSRIPRVKEIIKDFFNGKEPNNSINPDEAIAAGAAIRAAILGGIDIDIIDDFLLEEITPLSISIQTIGGLMSNILIPRGTKIPTKMEDSFTTVEDNQEIVQIDVYEGEMKLAKDNYELGTFSFKVPPASMDKVLINVTFEIDHYGILTVTAQGKEGMSKREIIITSDTGRLSSQEVEEKARQEEEFIYAAKQAARSKDSKSALINYLNSVKDLIEDSYVHATKIRNTENEALISFINETFDWLNLHPHESAKEYQIKFRQLEVIWYPIITKLHQRSREPVNENHEEL